VSNFPYPLIGFSKRYIKDLFHQIVDFSGLKIIKEKRNGLNKIREVLNTRTLRNRLKN